MRRFAALVLLLASAAPVGAESPGAAMLALPVSVRQAGLGGIAVGGRDPAAAWANPALLPAQTGRGELALGGGSLFAGDQSAVSVAGALRVTDRLAAGAVFATYGASAEEVDEFGDPTGGSLDRRLTAGGVAAGWSFGRVRAGALAKFVNDDVLGDAATAIAFDAGVAADLGFGFLSAGYRNVGPALRSDDPATPGGVTLPRELRAGGGVTLPGRGLIVAVEAAMPDGPAASVAAGVEWQAGRVLALRAGTADLADAAGRLSVGLSASPDFCDIDYAMTLHPAGAAHRASVSYAWGRPKRVRTRTVEVRDVVVPAGERLNLAVQDLTAQGVSPSDAAVITDLLRGELVKTGSFKVLERSNMEKILSEHSFQQTGCTSEECAIKLGKLLNVQRMIMGSAGKLMSAYIVNIRVVDIQTGEIVYTDEARGTDDRDLTARIRDLAARLAATAR